MQERDAEQHQNDKEGEAATLLAQQEDSEVQKKEKQAIRESVLKERDPEHYQKNDKVQRKVEQKKRELPLKERDAEQHPNDKEGEAAGALSAQLGDSDVQTKEEQAKCEPVLKERDAEQHQNDKEGEAAGALSAQQEDSEVQTKEKQEKRELLLKERVAEQHQNENEGEAATVLAQQDDGENNLKEGQVMASHDVESDVDVENLEIVVDLTCNNSEPPCSVADMQQSIASTSMKPFNEFDPCDRKTVGGKNKEIIMFKLGSKKQIPKALVPVYFQLRTLEQHFMFGQCFLDEKNVQYTVMGFTVQEDFDPDLQSAIESAVAHLHVKSGAKTFSDLIVPVKYLQSLLLLGKITDLSYEQYRPLFMSKVICILSFT